MPPEPPVDPRDLQLRAFEEQATIQRLDVPSAEAYLRAAQAMRARSEGAAPQSRLLFDWVLPIVLGLIAALVLALLTWLVLIV